VKLGAENRKQVIAVAVLGAIALVLIVRWLWPEPQTSASAHQTATTPDATNQRRTPFGKGNALAEPRLDPTLDFDMLHRSEEIKYAGNGRNIFVPGSVPTIERPLRPGVTQQTQITAPPPPPPPPPINLKFFGFASKPGEPKKVFLSKDNDVFVAGEGEIVDRRYRILRVTPTSVEIEDVLYNNKQSIPLTQG